MDFLCGEWEPAGRFYPLTRVIERRQRHTSSELRSGSHERPFFSVFIFTLFSVLFLFPVFAPARASLLSPLPWSSASVNRCYRDIIVSHCVVSHRTSFPDPVFHGELRCNKNCEKVIRIELYNMGLMLVPRKKRWKPFPLELGDIPASWHNEI